MKRLGLALLAFWILLAGVVVVVALNTEDTPKPTPKPPEPMTCASLQKRAERCANGLSDLAGDLYAQYARKQGESEFVINTKVTVVVSVVFGAIGEKKIARYCKRYWDSKLPRIRQAKAGLAACFAQAGCKPFLGCLRELAQRVDFTSRAALGWRR